MSHPTILIPNRRVLIIDDAPSIHDDFRRILGSREPTRAALEATEAAMLGEPLLARPPVEFEVDSALQGEDGIKRVAQALDEGRPYAVAFVDLRMPPGWDGVITARKILEIDAEIHLVICTAYTDYSWNEVLDTLGGHDRLLFLKKPFDVAEAFQCAYASVVKWQLHREAKLKTAELERRVANRTAELQKSNVDLQQARVAALNMMEDAVEARNKTEAAHDDLKQSEERYRTLVEFLPDAICILTDERFVLTNQAGAMLFGFANPREVEGHTIDEIVHPDCLSSFRDRIRQLRDARQVLPPSEQRLLRRHGSGVDAELRVAPFLFQEKPSALVILRDITEQKVLAEKLLRNQRLESIGTLAGGIAHDLNNVLAPILMSIELLRMEFQNPSTDRILATIQSSALRGADMVKQVLAFARGVQGKTAPLQIGHLVMEIARTFKHTLPKTIQVRTEIEESQWTVIGNATHLHQVIMNLGVNARDAMPDGGTLTLRIENLLIDEIFVSTHPEAKAGPHVVVSVADTGQGIPEEIRDRIFEPFFTTKPVDQGTGLGLSTVRGIVKSHGGFVTVHSTVGKGTEFKVFLPAENIARTNTASTAAHSLSQGHGELILVVDDEASILQMTKAALEMLGYRVVTAKDGADAIAVFVQNRGAIRLMLTDMMMPVMDGVATIRAVRSLAPDVKIVGASGVAPEPRARTGEPPLVDAFLQKPYTADRLVRTIQEVLTEAR